MFFLFSFMYRLVIYMNRVSWKFRRPWRPPVPVISVGNILIEAVNASKKLRKAKIENSVIDLRYIKPLENKVLKTAFKKFKRIFVIEEHFTNGGVGSSIIEWANKNGYDTKKINLIGIENNFVNSAGNQSSAREQVGLSSEKIFRKIIQIIKKK